MYEVIRPRFRPLAPGSKKRASGWRLVSGRDRMAHPTDGPRHLLFQQGRPHVAALTKRGHHVENAKHMGATSVNGVASAGTNLASFQPCERLVFIARLRYFLSILMLSSCRVHVPGPRLGCSTLTKLPWTRLRTPYSSYSLYTAPQKPSSSLCRRPEIFYIILTANRVSCRVPFVIPRRT